MRARVPWLLCVMLLNSCSCVGKRESTSSPPQQVEAKGVTPAPRAEKPAAAANSSCPPVSLTLHRAEQPITIEPKVRSTPEGDVVDQLVVSRAHPELHQVLHVKDMDALSVLDKCAVRTLDVTFDGYDDIFVDLRSGAANTYAQYWAYDSAARKFIDLGEYPELQPDRARKRLKTYERHGSGGREYEAREYSFADHALVLDRQEVQTALANEDAFERVVSVRRGGQMTVVERQHVSTAPDR